MKWNHVCVCVCDIAAGEEKRDTLDPEHLLHTTGELLTEVQDPRGERVRQCLESRHMALRNYLRVSRADRPDVEEGHELVVLVHDNGVDLATRNPTEKAISHPQLARPLQVAESLLVRRARPRYPLLRPIRAAYGPRKGYNSPESVDSQTTTLTSSPRAADAGRYGRRVSMPSSKLPERASLVYLKKRAKERLLELRRRDPRAKLAAAQLAVARDYGFPSWRSLKAEIDRRRAPTLTAFFSACDSGDVATLRDLVASEPSLVRERTSEGSTGLHLAARHAHAVRLLLEHGADPNARDVGDNAYALHFAAGAGALEAARALLDAGGDVHGVGDVHQLEVIGWATCFGATIPQDVLELLLERGARHHIFSAIAVQDAELIQQLVEENPDALSRRLSRFENGQTALHYVIAPPDGLLGGGFRTGAHYAILDLLIELGADLEAEDDKGRTPLTVAMLKGDEEAMRRLQAAGARVPKKLDGPSFDAQMSALASSIKRADAMICVPNVRATVDWYRSIGFELAGQHEIDSNSAWAGLSLGGCFLMLVPSGTTNAKREVSFWFRTDRVEDLYQLLKRRQLERASAVLAGTAPAIPEARFKADLHDTLYGDREFTIVDLNGYELTFAQELTS
jgi:ankyrin repeat protein